MAASALAVALLLPLGAAHRGLAQPADTDRTIQFFQSRLARSPGDAFGHARLGQAYIQKARETGDLTYYELAEKALARAIALGPRSPTAVTATTQLALIAHTRHQFRDAIAHAERALASGSGDLSPYAIIGDAHVDLGEYDLASAAYARLSTLAGPRYPHSRLSYLRWLRGDPRGAIRELETGVQALRDASVPRENVAWSQAQLGELFFQVGELGPADAAYRDALASHAGYHRALAGLARVRAAQADYEEAIQLYRQALGVIPLPEYAAALGDVYTRVGRPQEARKQYDLVEYIGRLNALNQTVYNRELALFYADHDLSLPRSLELAERELGVRRDIYTFDVLAWARYKNGRPREALGAMTEALRLGTQDARLLFHAGMIHQALGEPDRAREYLRGALAANPYFDLLQADVARRTLKDLEGRSGQP